MSKSRARLLAELLNSAGRVKKDKSDLAGADSIIDLDTIPTITNAKLENSSISIADHSVSLGGSVTLNTGDIGEHTNYKYYTDARARAAISVDGSLSYNSSTGVLSYTTPTTIASLSNHDTDDLAEGTNLYFTNARARGAISVSGSTISYDSSTGVITSTANNYSLPTATASVFGGVKIGYTENGKNYPVELSSGQMYVNVPWVDTNTTYSVGDGGLTQNNFTDTLKTKLDGIATSANNYVLPFTDNSSNWNTAYGWGNHASAGYLTSHQSLAAYAPLASPAFTGTPTAPTASAGTNTTQIATTAFVGTAVSNLVDSAPGTLNTLNELAAALGDDANFSTTVTNSIATKLPLAGGTVTGAGTTALTVTNTSGNGGYFNVNSNVGAVSTDGSVGLHIGWNKSNGGREINMIFDGGTSQADTEMIFTSTDGSTYTDIFQINGGGNVDIKSGGLRIGTTTVINSSRQISSAQIHNTGVIYLGSTATANDQLATNNGTDIFIGTSAKGLRTYKDLHTNSGNNKYWHAGNDGSGSGLDADTLDGVNSASFLRLDSSSPGTQSIPANKIKRFYSNDAIDTTNGSESSLEVFQDTAGADAFMTFHVSGDYAAYFGLDGGTNDLAFGGWSRGAASYKVWHAGNDGTGSGLDADTVDGKHKDFLMHYKGIVSGNWDTIFSQTDGHMGVYEVQNITNTDSNYPSGAYSYGGVLSWQLDNSTFKMYAPHTGSLYIQNGWNNDEYSGWRKIWDNGNDGASSGLDADLLDGQHGAYYQNAGNLNAGTIPEARLPTISKYLRSDTADTGSGKITLTATEGLEVGGIRGRAIGDQSGDFIQLYERVSIGYPSGWGASAAGAPAYGLSTHGGAQFNKGNVSGAPFTFNGHTIWHAGNDGSGSGLDADNLDGYSKADINPAHSHYRWTGISASGTQARRFVIMRLYGTPAHWDSNWQDIHLKVWSESYEATNLKYEICGDYNGGNQNTMFQLRLKDAGGSSEHGRFRLVLGTPVDAGWDHSGQNTYYVDVYAEAAHYMQFTVAADFYSAGFNVNTLPTSGGATTVVYSSPSVSNITTFNEAKEHSYFANHKIWNDGNHGSASGLDADLLDGEHGSSFLRSNANDTATGVIVFDQATQYFRKNNATNYTNGSLMVESYGGSSSIAAMGFHISGQLGRMLSMNSAGTLNWNDDVSISGSYFTPNTSANGLKSANGNNFFLPLDSYNNMHIRSTTGSEYHDSTAYYFRKVDQSNLLTITASNTNVAAGTLTRGGNTVWDAGNDGSGSGLDADTVDGLHYVSHLGLGKRQTITVYGDTDKYYPMIISGNAGHISTYKIHRGYSEHGPNDWNTSSHKGGLSFMYNIMGASGWGGYPTRVHVIEAGEIYSSLLGGILHHAHTMKHVVWLRGGGSGGGRYHIDSNSDFTVEVSSLSTDSHYKNSTDGWYTYNHSNDTYDQTVNYRTLTERNTAMQNEIFANMDVNYSTGTISHQLHGAPTPNKTYIHTGNMGTDCNADQLDGYHASDFPRLNTTNTFGTNHINYFGVARGTTSGSLNTGNLQVYASGTNSAFMSFHRGGSYAVNMGLDSDNVLRIGGWSASANRWVLDMSGNMTAAGNITAYSDIRLKENIEVIPNALEKVQKIRGVTFTRNDQDDKEARHTGVIAQEVEKVLPEVVAEDDLGIKNVAYGNMVGLLIEAVKELKQEVEDLKTQLKER